MTSLSSVSKSLAAAVLIALLSAAQAVYGLATGNAVAVALGLLAVLPCLAAIRWLALTNRTIRKAHTVIAAAEKGDLQPRILHIHGNSDIADMLRTVNRLLDRVESFG